MALTSLSHSQHSAVIGHRPVRAAAKTRARTLGKLKLRKVGTRKLGSQPLQGFERGNHGGVGL